jgi:multidrug transporter EmrE-like cation transporter
MKFTSKEFLYVSLFVLVIVVVENMAQFCLKEYQKSNVLYWYLLGVVFYAAIAFLLVISFQYEKMAIVNIMWGSLSALILTLVAYYFYGETLTQLQIFGIVIILIGTALLHLEN